MASKTKPDKAAKTISDAFALSHFFVANFILVLGEFTSLFDFIVSPHPGMDFVKQYISAPAMLVSHLWWNDKGTLNLWVSMEGIIIAASLVYWVLCYLATRFILVVME
jgi:hypothetical protein